MNLGYYVLFDNGKYLNVDIDDLVSEKSKATLFEDEFSANYMAEIFEMEYRLIPLEICK